MFAENEWAGCEQPPLLRERVRVAHKHIVRPCRITGVHDADVGGVTFTFLFLGVSGYPMTWS